MTRIALLVASLATTVLLPQALPAQAPGNSDVAARVALAQKANATLMQQYSWTSRTEILDQGEVKDIRIDLVNYGPNGQLQRSIVNDQSASLPRGFLRRRIAERERQKMEDYLTGLRDLLELYTLPTAAKIQDFLSRSKATGPDAAGLFEVTGQNVVLPPDTFSIWVNPLTRHAQKVQVSTTFQGDPVSLTASFKTLPSGLNHVAYGAGQADRHPDPELRLQPQQLSVR